MSSAINTLVSWVTMIILTVLLASCSLANQEDTTPPVITLIGSASMSIDVGKAFEDPGATASDDVDGDLTDRIIAVSAVNSSKVGVYTVRYNVNDFSGNAAEEVVREVVVRDPDAPYIFLEGDETIIIAQGEEYIDPGAIAIDEVDGDISHLLVVNNPVDSSTPGTYTVTFNTEDLSGNSAIEVSRTVIVDGSPPVITLLGDAVVEIPLHEGYTDAGATAVDDVDGDITDRISVYNPVNTNSPATFIVSYDVIDTAGNPADQVTREVKVVDVTPPVIYLSGDSKMLTRVGEPFTDQGATAQDNVDGDISDQIVVYNPVDINTPGLYFITYNVSDAAGNPAVEVTRQVDVVFFSSCFGQGAGSYDSGSDIIEVPGNNYIVVGTSTSVPLGRPDIWVIKVDGSGNEVWNAVFGTSSNDYGYALCEASDGNYLVLGWTASNSDTWVIKIDTEGNELWTHSYEGMGWARGFGIIESSYGELLLAGLTVATESSDQQMWVAKLDSAGIEIWSEAYGGTGSETGTAIVEAADGNYMIVGYTNSQGAGSDDLWVVKIDPDGNEVWNTTFGGSGEDIANSIVKTADDNFVIAGTTNSFGAGGNDVWVIKIDDAGNQIWNTTAGSSSSESGSDVVEAPTGGYLVIGKKVAPLAGGEDEMWVVHLDVNGNFEGERIFGGWRDDYGAAIVVTSDGYSTAVGTSSSYGDTHGDIWVIKF
jgi:hypothetical protein